MWYGGYHGHSSAENGLPFAGIPSELAEKTKRILGGEPDHPPLSVEFSQRVEDDAPFTLRSFLGPHRLMLLGAGLLMVLETATNLVGPYLFGLAIDSGVQGGAVRVLVYVFIAYLAAILINSQHSISISVEGESHC